MQLPGKQSFLTTVGSDYHMPFDNGTTLVLTLDKLVERCDLDGQGLENYSLFFSGPVDFPLSQGTYSMGHEQLGQLYLFLVPIGREQQRMFYQAVISAAPVPAST